MLLVCGLAGGTGITGTLYEPDEDPPSYRGAPDATAPYVWVCDSFYAVESGGRPLQLDDRVVRVAFERPSPRGFASRSAAIAGAKTHIREQFARIDIADETEFVLRTPDQ